MRRAITAFLRLCLRIFFRRIELLGMERVPGGRPVIFAVNHPNGLVDPLFLLCHAPAPVSFLGKAPLLGYPVIGYLARTFDMIPVYRKQDNSGGSNAETFSRARDVLRRGGSIAIFPEGTTHDDPKLRDLKTGAARIALGAELEEELLVVPTGIYYTAKHVFRSSALVLFGEPLHVKPVPTDATGEPPVDDVEDLTAAIEAGLRSVTLQADSHAALELVGRAEDIFTADDEQPLVEEFDLRRRFIDGYHYLRMRDPARLEKLQAAITQFEAELRRAKLDVHELRPEIDGVRLFRVLVLLPLALLGAVISYPTYRLVGFLAHRLSKGERNVLATMKFLGALALYPLTYLAIAIVAGLRFGWLAGVVTALAVPFLGYIALYVFEEIDDVIGDLRAVGHRLFRKYGYTRLLAQREAIRREMVEVAREMG
ncbi:MAG TPA: lysophospholipid acyltransferase family protein [Thermoanaerobaculia bacterium]|nr:lysophospholipid acyltransferase family protein [Thermoanaerobaculia bacterium]